LTSIDAQRLLAGANSGSKSQAKGRRGSKADIDRMAAKLILESWFNQPSTD
jgi:RNase H-fold protein (predicted Holliday junction resolvase)